MFEGGRATETVLTLRDTKVGCIVSLALPEEGRGESEEDEGPGPPREGVGEEGGASPL